MTTHQVTFEPISCKLGGRVQRAKVMVGDQYVCQEITHFPSPWDVKGETKIWYHFCFCRVTRGEVLAAGGLPENILPDEYTDDPVAGYVWYHTEDLDHALQFHKNLEPVLKA